MKLKQLAMMVGLLCIVSLGCGQNSTEFPGEEPGSQRPEWDDTAQSSAGLQYLFPFQWGSRPLEHSNGNKIVVGRFNSLHAVYQSGSFIRYTTTLDGTSWTTPVILSDSLPSKLPAIGVDSVGNVGVVWVSNPGADGLGALRYAYKPATSTVWTTVTLTPSGTEPAIVGHGSSMHVAWTSVQMVQYTSFPTLAPPTSPLMTGEILESSSCPNTGFRKPSITLVASPCKPPVPRVAYLYYSDEQNTVGLCQSLETVIGPHVCERNNTSATWSLIYSNDTESTVDSSVEPISCSISANFATGHTVLAWSDQQSGTARTMLARGQGGTWAASTFDTQRHHVHVRANGSISAPATQFRLAWTGAAGFSDEFFSPNAYWNTATWTGAAPVWTGAVEIGDGFGSIGRPQTVFWKRCSQSQYATTNAYFEADGGCLSVSLATDYLSGGTCPSAPIPGISASPCQKFSLAVALQKVGTGTHTLVDTQEIGTVTRTTSTSATITTNAGGTVTATWSQGNLVSSWDNGFTITAPRSTLRFLSRDTSFSVTDYGYLTDYEPSKISLPGTCPK